MDKWVSELSTNNVVRLIDEFNTPDVKLPQYIHMQHCEKVWSLIIRADSLYEIFVKNYVEKYYEKVDNFFYWNKSPKKEQVDYVYQRHLWKLKPEHEHRMIRAGYGKDIDNKSMGKYFDIERAFHGYPGPLTSKLNHMFKDYELSNLNGLRLQGKLPKITKKSPVNGDTNSTTTEKVQKKSRTQKTTTK